jgi:hypothetical protein
MYDISPRLDDTAEYTLLYAMVTDSKLMEGQGKRIDVLGRAARFAAAAGELRERSLLDVGGLVEHSGRTYTWEVVAARLGVTKQAASQMYKRARARLAA